MKHERVKKVKSIAGQSPIQIAVRVLLGFEHGQRLDDLEAQATSRRCNISECVTASREDSWKMGLWKSQPR